MGSNGKQLSFSSGHVPANISSTIMAFDEIDVVIELCELLGDIVSDTPSSTSGCVMTIPDLVLLAHNTVSLNVEYSSSGNLMLYIITIMFTLSQFLGKNLGRIQSDRTHQKRDVPYYNRKCKIKNKPGEQSIRTQQEVQCQCMGS